MTMKMDLKQKERLCNTYQKELEQHAIDSAHYEKVKSSIISKEEVYDPNPDIYVNDLTNF